MQDSAGPRRIDRHQIPPERLPELFGAQFFRFLPGLEASGRSRTDEPSSSEAVSSTAVSTDSRQLYSVHLPSLTSASTLMARSEEGTLAAHSGESRVRLKKEGSAESLASGSEARTIPASTRAMLAIRRSRILGMPMAYYALLIGSMALCAFSYAFASKTMSERSAHIPGHSHMAAKERHGGLLNVPVPPSSSTGKDLAHTTWHRQPQSVRAHGGSRRHAKRPGRKSKRSGRRSHSAAATAASTKAAVEDVDLTPDSATQAQWEPPVMETTPSVVQDTAATTFAPASLPSAPTVTGGSITQNGTFNSSANLDEYEEVFEYYYVYDDNETSTSSTPQPAQYAELAIPINQ